MEFFPKGGKLNNYRIKRTFKESIEPEEILLDAKKSDRLEGSKLELPINPGVFRIFVVLSMLLIIVLVGRSFYLQVIKEGQYAKLSDQNKTRVYPIFSQRGIIYDQFSTQLVYNVPSFDLEVIFNDLPKKEEERQLVIEKISSIIGLAPQEIEDEIYQYLKKNQAGFVLSDNLSQENVLRLEAEAADIPGFVIVKNIVRQYVDGFYFSHLLGYLGRLNSQDLQNNPDYFLTEKIGKQGLELFYEEELRGQPGKKEIEIDALGSEKKETISQQPAAGHGLILTVDKNLQIKLFDEL
ncbi:MAG: Penicillin-binding protein 2, partial [Parcubacteria group bacterium GW2011_GWC2_42_6]